MKHCPKCGRHYGDADINFCLDDGELLMRVTSPSGGGYDDSPPTVIMGGPRATNPAGWAPGTQNPQWQAPMQAARGPNFGVIGFGSTRDQSIATVSLILGVASMIMVCCYGGLWLGIPAVITGIIGYQRAKSEPERFTGSGMAVAGIILGLVTAGIFILQILFVIASSMA